MLPLLILNITMSLYFSIFYPYIHKYKNNRYDLLESQNGLIMDGDSDSDEIDIFDKANTKE